MEMSWITAISLMHSQDIDLFGNIIVKLINIKLFDLLTCCHYILKPPRRLDIEWAGEVRISNHANFFSPVYISPL